MDSTKPDVTKDNGGVQVRREGVDQHDSGETSHGEARLRLQGQNRGNEGRGQDLPADCEGSEVGAG